MSSILAVLTGVLLAAGDPVTAVSVVPNLTRTEVLVSIEGAVSYRAFNMEGPSRIVLDLINAQHALPQEDFLGINRGGVVAVRTSQYAEDIVRVVVELERTSAYVVEATDGTVRISIENESGQLADLDPWETRALLPSPAMLVNQAPVVALDQPTVQQASRRISISFDNTPIEDVLFTFSEFSGKSIVPGSAVVGTVTADIRDQAWDHALEVILASRALIAIEDANGIIRVAGIENLNQREAIEPLLTVPYRISYGTSSEMALATSQLISERGQVAEAPGTNTVIVTDIQRVHDAISGLIASLDIPTPQVMISAKIIFVNRTDLSELGVTYELKDSQGNQLNVVAPGFADLDGDGAGESVDIGTNVFTLGGNSVSALGNAGARIAAPSLRLLTSLVMGRHTLVNFIEALESSNLSDIQAAPSVTVADNQQARLQVGERTPIRVIDAAAGGAAGGGGFPTANVSFEETGIILEATPHITGGDHVLLTIHAERSAADVAESDIGLIFRTQNADTRVLVRDGETVVIGGLTVTELQEIRSGIPLLMNLPLLGGLFRTSTESQVQRDLMILVTPHIVRGNFN